MSGSEGRQRMGGLSYRWAVIAIKPGRISTAAAYISDPSDGMGVNGLTLNKPRVLHVVAGRGLPVYFANAIRSVRAAAPVDRVLVIDNATPSLEFRREIIRIVEQDEKMDLILRPENELQNRKVGGLYEAYRLGFAYAIERGFHLLHLIQSDAQLLWWDDDLVERAVEIFDNHPACVNISTMLLPRDRRLGDELLRMPSADRLIYLRGYGLTDTGLYHLDRWRKHGFDFGPSEGVHGKHYRDLGFEVIYHPWPTVAPIPWPTVIRSGVQRGTEVATGKPFLLKPMSRADAWHMKAAMTEVWLEEFCIPWGWVCPTPMWVTGSCATGTLGGMA